MVTVLEVKLTQKNGFNGVGVKWVGTHEQAANGELRVLLHEFKQKIGQIKNVVHNDAIIGVSYTIDENSFKNYFVVETANCQEVPDGMECISIPSGLYVTSYYNGYDTQSEYIKLFQWIEENGYKYNPALHSLEFYPIEYNPLSDIPKLTIYLPIKEVQKDKDGGRS